MDNVIFRQNFRNILFSFWKMKRNGLQYKRLEYVMGHMSKKGQNHLKAKKVKNAPLLFKDGLSLLSIFVIEQIRR